MKLPAIKKKIIETLKEAKRITAKDIERAEHMRQDQNIRFFDALVKLNLVTERELVTMLSSQCGIPFLDLSKFKIGKDMAALIPEKVARRYVVIPVSSIGKQITLAMADPFNMLAIDDIIMLTQFKVSIAISTEKDVIGAIDELYRQEVDLSSIVEKAEEGDSDTESSSPHEVGSAEDGASTPLVRIIDLIMIESYKKGASDIHIEPYEDIVRVRFRVDGHLREMLTIPKKNQNALVARIKILSNLDITENRIPQDGRFKIRFGQREVDYRVSMLPVYWGTKIVMRALDKSNLKLGLGTVGFSQENLIRFAQAIKKPYGMIIITGPTGSGKSTTLYSILTELNTIEKNIITIEDPIEYQVAGITQMQARSDIGFTFSSGLRAMLRQSPDIVMLGEIRDGETADIAIKAALTGQVVLSTLHTNDAPTAVTRLVDMGVEPFLISSSLTLVAAQRLCRKICSLCKEKIMMDKKTLEAVAGAGEIFKDREPAVFRGRGCEKCGGTGYKGRVAIAETLFVDDGIRHMIEKRGTAGEIKAYAVKNGMTTLRLDALLKVREGVTTLEEVVEVTAED